MVKNVLILAQRHRLGAPGDSDAVEALALNELWAAANGPANIQVHVTMTPLRHSLILAQNTALVLRYLQRRRLKDKPESIKIILKVTSNIDITTIV